MNFVVYPLYIYLHQDHCLYISGPGGELMEGLYYIIGEITLLAPKVYPVCTIGTSSLKRA